VYFSYSVRVQSQIRVVSSSSIYLFFCVSLNALDRENTLTNSDTHTGSWNLFSFVSVCHIYIPRICFVLAHCAYYCCCSLVSLFWFLFSVVICCHCRLLLCLNIFFYALFNIFEWQQYSLVVVHHAIATKPALHKCACLVFDLTLSVYRF
jgi:hypothetical protein